MFHYRGWQAIFNKKNLAMAWLTDRKRPSGPGTAGGALGSEGPLQFSFDYITTRDLRRVGSTGRLSARFGIGQRPAWRGLETGHAELPEQEGILVGQQLIFLGLGAADPVAGIV